MISYVRVGHLPVPANCNEGRWPCFAVYLCSAGANELHMTQAPVTIQGTLWQHNPHTFRHMVLELNLMFDEVTLPF